MGPPPRASAFDLGSAAGVSLYGPSQQHVAQDNGIIMKLVMGREHEGYWTLACPLSEPAEMFRLLAQFSRIATPEFLPTGGIVSEPFSQFGAGRGILQPFIDRRGFLCHAAGPKPIDQYSYAVIASRRLICSL
jgi:hypothetical protein